jgi:hypothetical protein
MIILEHLSLLLTPLLAVALAIRWFAVPRDQQRTEWLLVALIAIEPADALLVRIAYLLTYIRPFKFDLFVYQFDQLFGQPSFWLGSLVLSQPALQTLMVAIYGILSTSVFLTFAAYVLNCDKAEMVYAGKVLGLNLLLAIPIYLLFPVSGPRYAFANFPHLPASVFPQLIAIHAAPNGVPSVHTSTALLVFWLVRRWKWGRLFAGTFLVLTVLTALASGEHYLFDVLFAVLYSISILKLANTKTSQEETQVAAALELDHVLPLKDRKLS